VSRLSVSVLVVLALYAAPPVAQVQAQAVRAQPPLATRLVQLYSGYERQLAEAVNRKDTMEIDRLLSDDFELWSANNIDVPTVRPDWIAQSLKESPASVSIGEMAVHDYGNIRIVSFVMKRAAVGHKEPNIAVVDVWVQSDKTSVLKLRYAAIQTAHSQLVPGEVRQQQINKRY
jgi:hypothetical protein